MKDSFSVAIVTVSDRAARGEREDRSTQVLTQLVAQRLGSVVETVLVADEREDIESALIRLIDKRAMNLVLTTGGTGVSPRDVTPEATRAVIERDVPGVAEFMRAEGLRHTPMAMISRAICGIRKQSVILNLPGSPRGAVESLDAVLSLLPHLIKKVQGDPHDCGRPVSQVGAE